MFSVDVLVYSCIPKVNRSLQFLLIHKFEAAKCPRQIHKEFGEESMLAAKTPRYIICNICHEMGLFLQIGFLNLALPMRYDDSLALVPR
jgi:hypothetical protein